MYVWTDTMKQLTVAVCFSVAEIMAKSVRFFGWVYSSSDCDVSDGFKHIFNGHNVEHEFPIQNNTTSTINVLSKNDYSYGEKSYMKEKNFINKIIKSQNHKK